MTWKKGLNEAQFLSQFGFATFFKAIPVTSDDIDD